MKSRPTFDQVFGCILGTAIGDAVGLKREGLSRNRAIWLHGSNPSPDLIFGRGFCSDDTEHTVLAGIALLKSGGDVKRFKRSFATLLRKWLLTAPAGIGLGTLRAILKSMLVGPDRSGVNSAGNGPAMRAALFGLLAKDESHLVELVRASTRITHTDPRAEEGALVVARAARFAATNASANPIDFVRSITPALEGDELRRHFEAMEQALATQQSAADFADSRGWPKGPTGFINQTVPMAVYCWALSPKDYQAAVTDAVLLGGDTDSVGAITGAITGAGCGANAIPEGWKQRLAEWPRDVDWMRDLSERLTERDGEAKTDQRLPSLRWGRTLLRNLVFAAVVIVLYLRRFIPIPART